MEKTCTIVKIVDTTLIKKKLLILVSTEIDTIRNSDIYDTCKDVYLSEKERTEKLL